MDGRVREAASRPRSYLWMGLAALVAAALTAPAAPALAAAAAKPIPRAADGHVDLSGVWLVFQSDTASGLNAMADPPMSKAGEAKIKVWRDQYNLKDMEPNAYCVEPGMPTTMYGVGAQPFELVQDSRRVSIVSEVGMQYRRIFMDNRQPPDGYLPTRNGWSNGRWDGDALVVETQAIAEWLMPRWAHTDDTKTTERFHLIRAEDAPKRRNAPPIDDGAAPQDFVLVEELTMFDPNIYDVPPKITLYFRKLPDSEFYEQACSEGLWWQEMEKLKKK